MDGMKKNVLAAAGLGAATAAAAFLGSRFNPSGDRGLWYESLDKPPFTPPNAVFPIVWTALYAAMAVSAFRVWKTGDRRALPWWAAQLALNAAWSPIFFGAQSPKLALADLIALFVAIAGYTNEARKADRPAAWMMAPYLVWVAFAGALNAEIARRL
jgi:translocator protein